MQFLTGTEPAVFRRVAEPSAAERPALVHRIAARVGRSLERQGLLIQDCDDSYLALDPTEGPPMNDLLGHSITYRIAIGPRAGERVFALQSVPLAAGKQQPTLAHASGFSLHAGVAVKGGKPKPLEHLCRYISRPALATERLALTGTLSWMQRLKRVFAIDIETCRRCGGQLKVIASIEEPAVIGRLLAHLDRTGLARATAFNTRHPDRDPPPSRRHALAFHARRPSLAANPNQKFTPALRSRLAHTLRSAASALPTPSLPPHGRRKMALQSSYPSKSRIRILWAWMSAAGLAGSARLAMTTGLAGSGIALAIQGLT